MISVGWTRFGSHWPAKDGYPVSSLESCLPPCPTLLFRRGTDHHVVFQFERAASKHSSADCTLYSRTQADSNEDVLHEIVFKYFRYPEATHGGLSQVMHILLKSMSLWYDVVTINGQAEGESSNQGPV